MFRKEIKKHFIEEIDFSGVLFPKASDRAHWDKRKKDEFIIRAEDYLNYDWPVAKATDFMAFKLRGERLPQEKFHFARRYAFNSLIIGEIAEYKGRFIPDIVNGLFAICEETFWGLSAHWPYVGPITSDKIGYLPDAEHCYIDLFAAETASSVALCYYLLYDELESFCPDIIPRIEYELNRRIVTPYLTHHNWFWMGYGSDVFNWNPWIISNVLTVFLSLNLDNFTRANGIYKMFNEIEHIYECYPDDGGCDEGASYWGVSGGAIFEFCELIYRATNGKIDMFGDEKLQNILKYQMKTYTGNGKFANFSDGTNGTSLTNAALSYCIGDRIGSDQLKCFAGDVFKTLLQNQKIKDSANWRDCKLKRELFVIEYYDSLIAQKDYVPDDICVLPYVENGFFNKDNWTLCVKGGNNDEGHNHNDVGQFIAAYDKKHILIDPGCGTYSAKTFSGERYTIWTMQSRYHNLPLVNGEAQHNGPKYKTSKFEQNGFGVTVEFADAYNENAKINTLTRTVQISDGIKISDEFEFEDEKNEVTEYFMTACNAEIKDGKVILDNKFVLESDNGNAFVEFVDLEHDTKLTEAWGCEKLVRIGFTFTVGKEFENTVFLRRI